MADPVKLLTWNVAGRLTRLDEQADRAIAHACDVVCLQEVIPKALARWSERLQAAGYVVTASAVAPAAPRVHRLGVLVAGRHPITLADSPPALPWPEGEVKIRTLEAVHASLAALGDEAAAILCGDFNTPQYEARDRSWKSGRHPGYRLDHILISPALTAVASAYDHSLREDGLSDHSGMWATVGPRPTVAAA